MIKFFFEQTKPMLLRRSILKEVIKRIIGDEGFTVGEVSVIFCNDEYLLDINQRFLEHDYYTDIITFDYSDKQIISGDLYISLDRVNENAKLFDTSFFLELQRVIFHGILHLVGYDDKNDEMKKVMREKENFYLNLLGSHGK